MGCGLHVDGLVVAERRRAVRDRHELSVGLVDIRTRPRADGGHDVTSARLKEVSVVRHARWAPYTPAVLTLDAA
jgi:hypothetical protein